MANPAKRIVCQIDPKHLFAHAIDRGICHARRQGNYALGNAQHKQLHAFTDLADADRHAIRVECRDHIGIARQPFFTCVFHCHVLVHNMKHTAVVCIDLDDADVERVRRVLHGFALDLAADQ